MSSLAELIEQLCPDGVEYRPLGDVAELKRGQAVTRKEIVEGQIPVIAGGREPAYYIDRPNRQGETIVIAGSGAYAGFVSFWNEPIFVSDAFSIVVDRGTLQPRFVYHWLNGRQEAIHALKSGGGVPHVYPKDVAKLRCPIPPLEVQREIVRILDQFTTLEAELEVELEARRAQYEHYRNHLLSYDSLAACGPVDMVELGSVVTLLDSRRIPLKKGDRVSGEYPYYGASGIVDYVDSYIFDEDLLLVSEDGANLKARTKPIAFSTSGRVWVNNHAHVLKVESSFYQKFLEEYLNSLDLEPYLVGSTQPKLNQSGLLSIPVPLPTEQALERSVLLLEKLKLFVTDLSAGLPAEIAARRAQYEHYRDRLLSFPEKVVSVSDAS
jgi:hypothetical protein